MDLGLNAAYEDVVHSIIRPARRDYSTFELGERRFKLEGKRPVNRRDSVLKNERGHDLHCSHWEEDETHSWMNVKKRPCIIYLHGNSSCRLGALELVPVILSLGASLFAFDFSGCGKSEGDYVSLGWHERDDLQCVIKHLRATNKVASIALWGRSMGAATALLHAPREPGLSALILDSSFSSLYKLVKEISAARTSMPGFAVDGVMSFVKGTVKEKAGFDINDVEPIANLDQCQMPALFATGDEDTFIQAHHSKELHDAYAGEKAYCTFSGDHHSTRPSWFHDVVSDFLKQALRNHKEPTTNPDGTKIARQELRLDEPSSPIGPSAPFEGPGSVFSLAFMFGEGPKNHRHCAGFGPAKDSRSCW